MRSKFSSVVPLGFAPAYLACGELSKSVNLNAQLCLLCSLYLLYLKVENFGDTCPAEAGSKLRLLHLVISTKPLSDEVDLRSAVSPFLWVYPETGLA